MCSFDERRISIGTVSECGFKKYKPELFLPSVNQMEA